VINLKQSKMKNRIIEICELGQPQSIIHRENQPITELIKTDSLIEELNQQLRLHVVSNCTTCNVEINYKGVCDMCYFELKLNDLD